MTRMHPSTHRISRPTSLARRLFIAQLGAVVGAEALGALILMAGEPVSSLPRIAAGAGVTGIALCTFLWLHGKAAVRPLAQFAEALERFEPARALAPPPAHAPQELVRAMNGLRGIQLRVREHVSQRLQFLSAIAHDLQTPVARMRLRLEAMDDAPGRRYIIDDLYRMEHLVRDGVRYARCADEPRETPVKLCLIAFVDSLACDYRDAGRPVEFAPTDALVVTTCPQSLRRILANLVDNALKHGHRAALRTRVAGGDMIAIDIEDDGPGIPEDELAAVMEPFYRLRHSEQRDPTGSGLGLAIAMQLTLQLGGQLRLANRVRGGLCATLLIPRAGIAEHRVETPQVGRVETLDRPIPA